MENRIPNMEERRGGEPQRIGDILTEWMARYENRFPAAKVAIVQQAWAVMEAERSVSYPAELAMK